MIVAVLIFANGDIEDFEWIQPYFSRATAVIAADGGTDHLWHLDRLPDVVIGDLDSLSREIREWVEDANVPIFVYPHDKDETDLELALLYATAHYQQEEILIFGASGGRLDQTLANIMLLAHPATVYQQVELVTQNQQAWLVRDQIEIDGEVGDAVSLIPVAEEVLVKETFGLRWPLIDEVLAFGPARGISNEMTEPRARIIVGRGMLLCLHTRQSWSR